MASLKNTRSIPEPRTVSLYCAWKLDSRSINSSCGGIYCYIKNDSTVVPGVRRENGFINVQAHKSLELQTQSPLAHLLWAQVGLC